MAGGGVDEVPLRRNRDFLLLQTGQLLSNAGTQSTAIAYPLLVLALTHSPAQTGVVSFTRALPAALFAMPAGLAADRYSRKTLMIAADVVRALAIGILALLVITHHTPIGVIAIVAFIEGAGAAFFVPAQSGALRGTVPASQMPDAAAAQTGRQAAVQLAGPPIGGVLFQVAHALPFTADCVSYACSTASLLAMRTPFEEPRERDPTRLRTRVAEGFIFLWRRRFLRATALMLTASNFIVTGLLFSVVVIGKADHMSSAAIGILVGAFAACVLAGSLLSPFVRRRLSVRTVVLLEAWAWTAVAVFLVHPTAYVLVAAMVPAALAIPSTDAVVHGYRIALTPDRLLGRAESARTLFSVALAPFGPLLAGVLLAHSARVAVGTFAITALVLAICATASSSLRNPPPLAAPATTR